MGYSRLIILELCNSAIQNPSTFYQKPFVNYRGITMDTKEHYSEVIAEFLLNHLSKLNEIISITRETSYRRATHTGNYNESTSRTEELIAMKLFLGSQENGIQYGALGKVIDYQTPLKNQNGDKTGKIDLLAVNGKTLHLLELKKRDSRETMLRCILEVYTYLKTVNQEKLIQDFNLSGIEKVKASPLLFWGMAQWKELQLNRPFLKELIKTLEVNPNFLREVPIGYQIIEENENG